MIAPRDNGRKFALHCIPDSENDLIDQTSSTPCYSEVIPITLSLPHSKNMQHRRQMEQLHDSQVVMVNREAHLFTFVRILLRYLEAKHPALYLHAKTIVLDCANLKKKSTLAGRQHRHIDATLLLVDRLRDLVGEKHWEMTDVYTRAMLDRRAVNLKLHGPGRCALIEP